MLKGLLERMINKKTYISKEDMENKLNVFFTVSQITQEDYLYLFGLLNPPIPVEVPSVVSPETLPIHDHKIE